MAFLVAKTQQGVNCTSVTLENVSTKRSDQDSGSDQLMELILK